MLLERVRLVARVVFAALFAVEGVYLLIPGHEIAAYVRWGYPPWLHVLVGAALLATAVLLPFRRSRRFGAAVGGCVLVLETTATLLHGDLAHAAQGLVFLILLVWLLSPRRDRR